MAEQKSTSQAYRLNRRDFDGMVAALTGRMDVLAPRRFPGQGRCSSTDLIRYGPVESGADIVHESKSDFSPKEVVWPLVQTLFYLVEDQIVEPAVDARPALVFLRACDIHGLARLDDIFLRNGPEPDVYYQRLRSRVKLALIECRQGFENCFCVSMGTNRADDYALAVRFDGEQVFLDARDPDLAGLLEGSAEPADYRPTFVSEDPEPVTVPDPQRLTEAVRERDLFDQPLWDEYGQRCIACGRCNMVCPTCSCFSSFDLASSENPRNGERRRTWAGCHIDRFTDLAGGHQFRKGYGERMRFKTMHKIYDFHLRFGRHMCVGCGRCDDHCPEYISFSRCITRVAQHVEGPGHE